VMTNHLYGTKFGIDIYYKPYPIILVVLYS